MDGQILETLGSNSDHAVTLCHDNGKSEGDRDLTDADCASSTTQITGSNRFSEKIEDLSNKVQIMRKEHAHLRNELEALTADSLLSPEAFTALQSLSTENEVLNRKYLEECSDRKKLNNEVIELKGNIGVFCTENEVLKRKYLEECSDRKKLYNEVIELKGNIRVFCRCRPLKQNEIASGSTSVVDFDSSQDNELQIISSDSSRKQFKFDHVFRPEDDQDDIFTKTQPLVASVLDGYNVCIFAYGQTGTGKTYTMEGTPENRGVNYRTLEELFRLSSERSSIMRYELFVSMLEVYNEKIKDLLLENSNQPVKKLEIKQSAEGTQEVPGLVEARVYGTDEVWGLLTLGSRVRSVGSTNANELSSRSHCLLRVTVVGENLINGQKTKSHLWLVDLAGSERVGRIEVEGDRLKESQFINKSLSALGDVVSALASKTSHVPYRNSKLTHMLQSSLGGDCKTLMFVQISPNSADLGETLCSLNFASRVRGVEHGPARRQTDHAELFKYKQLAEKAKHDEKETKKLQDSLQSLQLRFAARENICRTLQEKVRDLENQLAEERKTRLKQENRALATISTHSLVLSTSNYQAQRISTERKPPLVPTKLRLPLQRITNFLPASSPSLSHKSKMSFLPVVDEGKENSSRTLLKGNNSRSVMQPRRGSIALRPSSQTTSQVLQPKRRASFATLRPEFNSNMTTPLHTSTARLRTRDQVMSRPSNVWDRQKIWRTLSLSSPLPRLRKLSAATVEATPIAPRSSKFRGSPPSQQPGSWRPKHPTVVALQKKQLVWSPLKLRGMKNNRKSFAS